MADFTKLNGYYAEDKTGREQLSDLKAYIGYNEPDIYGLCADFENSTFTRLAGAKNKTPANFNSIAPWGNMKRCILADNGTVVAYYGEQGYVEDGTAGQVMVEIPKFYYRVVPLKLQPQSWEDYEATDWTASKSYAVGDVVIYNSSYYACITANSDAEFTPAKWQEITEMGLTGYHLLKANYYVSATKYDGFKTHPLFVRPDGTERNYAYISAYEGCIYDVSASAYLLNDEQVADITASTGDKLSSIGGTFERSYTYYDKTNDTDVTITVNAGAKPCSGETASNMLTRPNMTKLAHNRGTGWEQQTIEATSAIQLLYAIEYASFNWQNTLGAGVTSITDDGKKNCSNFVGSTASLGNASGAASSTIDRTGTTQTANGKVSVSYRGIENFFGNVYKWVEGVTFYGAYNNGGGKVFICTDGVYTENKATGNYEATGFTVANKNQYVKYFGYGKEKYDWLFLTSKTGHGANTSIPVGDYTYVTANLNGSRVSFFGGSWSNGGNAGGCYWLLSYGSGHRIRYIGGRLLYLG